MDWDPFEDFLDEDDELEARRAYQRAMEHARTLDASVATCAGCGAETKEWLTRSGLTGTGTCRACMMARADGNAFAKETAKRLHDGLVALWKLRAERDRAIAKDLAEVPF